MVLREERKGIDKKFYELCEKVVKEEGLDLYDMDYISGSHCLRLFIKAHKTETAQIEECIKVDRALTEHIDESDWMPEVLNLEVSSPGLFRQITSIEHFKLTCGKDILLVLKSGLSHYSDESSSLQKKHEKAKKVIGRLHGADEDGIDIEIFNKRFSLPYSEIKKANLETKL